MVICEVLFAFADAPNGVPDGSAFLPFDERRPYLWLDQLQDARLLGSFMHTEVIQTARLEKPS